MFDYETYARIKSWHAEGVNYSQIIAGKLSIDPRTAAFRANEKKWRPRKSPKRPSKLDPFKNDIVRMLQKFPCSAEQIFQSIRRDGFDGGYTIVKEYVRKIRPPKTKAYLKLNFAPGECARIDWGCFGSVPVGSTARRLSFFVMVLCHSRMMYVEFTVSQTMEHFLACHQNALLFFGFIVNLWGTFSSLSGFRGPQSVVGVQSPGMTW